MKINDVITEGPIWDGVKGAATGAIAGAKAGYQQGAARRRAASPTKGGILSGFLKGAGATQAGQAVDAYNAAGPASDPITTDTRIDPTMDDPVVAALPTAPTAPTAPPTSATVASPTNSNEFGPADAFRMAGITQKPVALAATPNYGQKMAGYGKTTTTTAKPPVAAAPVAPPAATVPTTPAKQPVAGQPITIGGQKISPTDPAYAKIMKNAPAMAESKIDIAEALWRKMKSKR